ncbi:MAG: hypothetical protein GY719_30455 [bacterium]|nr:hypothetical protein [bacterium]
MRHLTTRFPAPTSFVALLALAWALGPATALADADATESTAEELPPLQVSHVGADSVYLNGGRSHGLSVGQAVAVLRDGEPVAELQVAFVSKKSASCRVVDSRLEIVLGDQAIPIPELDEPGPVPAATPTPAGPAPAAASEPEEELKISSDPPRSDGRKWADFSGTVSVRLHHFVDGAEIPRSFDQTTARLNLRTQSLGGAYEARIRVRGREDRRYRESEATETSRRDRLYELAFTYEPPDGRVLVEAGRMTSSPMLGFDYLDGVVGEYRFGRKGTNGQRPRFGVGGFYGQRSDVDEIGLGADGEAYGAFFHYQRKRTRESPFYADLLVGGIRELYEGQVSREFVSLYGRLGSGSRWSFYQRADVDINTDWRRDVAGDDYQVSNLLTTFNYRFNDSLRLGVSYDHRRRFRDFENRDTPEEIFDDRLREGLRLNAQIGDSRGWRLTTSVGVRTEENNDEDAYTGTGSIFHTNIGGHNLLLGVDFSGFSGDTSDGYRVSLRSRKYFDGGHDIGLTLGTSTTTNTIGGIPVDTENQWIRLSGTARLPKRFFLLSEVEITDGDDLAGERYILQLGYRL